MRGRAYQTQRVETRLQCPVNHYTVLDAIIFSVRHDPGPGFKYSALKVSIAFSYGQTWGVVTNPQPALLSSITKNTGDLVPLHRDKYGQLLPKAVQARGFDGWMAVSYVFTPSPAAYLFATCQVPYFTFRSFPPLPSPPCLQSLS